MLPPPFPEELADVWRIASSRNILYRFVIDRNDGGAGEWLA